MAGVFAMSDYSSDDHFNFWAVIILLVAAIIVIMCAPEKVVHPGFPPW